MLASQALSSKQLYQLLKELGVEYLYHSNTVATSISFIKEGALVTRKYAEDHELTQTPQDSDQKDKDHGVWDSLFLDGTDHHVVFNRRNYYGPILFKIKLELLLSDEFEHVFITRSNPSYWFKGMAEERKYYESMDEVRSDYTAGAKREDAQIMFTFPNAEKKMDFDKYLHSICYDDPKLTIPAQGGDTEGRDYLKRVLETALAKNGKTYYVLEQREHSYPTKCNCFKYYRNLKENDFNEFRNIFRTNI